ncbi:uncharacterized protein with ParB-like and HNH nuclease domain [Lactobacillus colini]|uniref:Uncharacterized protein with ParB-like and HNH nuclease domain n=1 Tax=Lactobacillus colini TaxID=1819254 RepID=A0ABS4MGE9_9LACO|nr:DUF262 domain-containing protein [Lactobacillus colini]MBP2058396.1 uncharacterized protein with ParB-like and HNH nuclease domain [Lactobacillus colini]
MKADSVHLFEFLGLGKTIFEIPVFQRNYEWGKEQCIQLFNDLTVAAQTDTDHFIGAVVYVTESGKKLSRIYRIIDGQQRLMSLTLLLKAIADKDNNDKDEIVEEYLTNKYVNDNNHLKLKPVDHDIQAFNAVMNEDIVNEEPSKVIENYELFKNLIDKSNLTSNQLFEAMNHFNMVYIELTDENTEENPQVIFESLNSTGVSLSPSDLVRNFLLMKLDSESQNYLYKKYWGKIEKMFSTQTFTEFIRHYLVLKTHKLIKKNKVYEDYKYYYVAENLSSESALADLHKFAIYYYQLLNSESNDDDFNRILDHINIMESKVVFPYLMLLMDMVDNGNIGQNSANELAYILENYLFRLKACKFPSNGLNKIVIGLCDTSKEEGNLKLRLLRLLKSKFPTDKQVYEHLMEVDLYHQRNHLAKLALIILEENRTKETVDFDNAQVEHILPQRLNNEWKLQVANAERIKKQYGGTLGNLTLTKYNQEMSNKVFSEKRDYYHDSNISLTREVANEYSSWDKDEIIDRTRKLTKELLDIFPMPDIKDIDTTEVDGEYSISDSIDITGKKPSHININGQEYSVSSWRQMLITFLNNIWNIDSLNFGRIKENAQLNKILFKARRAPVKLDNGITIETNFSATVVLAIISKIAAICDLTNEVSYTLK